MGLGLWSLAFAKHWIEAVVLMRPLPQQLGQITKRDGAGPNLEAVSTTSR